jgi:L(+)-tartrate dehydratase beta subunit
VIEKTQSKLILHTPLCDDDISHLRTGDMVYLSGIIVTGRDDVHRRVTREGMESPVDLRGGAIFHAGPIVREGQGGAQAELVSVGPTSSIRMEDAAAAFIKKTGLKLMVGKGGMGKKTAAACKEFCALHCVYPGGCAVLGAEQIEKIEGVFWRELGMPECMWVLRAREFGPLIVAIDTLGNNLFADNAALYAQRASECMVPVMESLKMHP